MIDQVLVMNLKRREDKWYFMLGALGVSDFPIRDKNIIRRFEAHDARQYVDCASVISAACQDGFPYFEKYSKFRLKDEYAKRLYAYHWTCVSALREIVQLDKIVMLLFDESTPVFGWNWNRYKGVVSKCYDLSSNFRGVQLRTQSPAEIFQPIRQPYDSILAEGLCGENETAIVLSKSGAQMLLDIHKEFFPDEFKQNIQTISQRGFIDEKYRDGFWHVLDEIMFHNIYHWNTDLISGIGDIIYESS